MGSDCLSTGLVPLPLRSHRHISDEWMTTLHLVRTTWRRWPGAGSMVAAVVVPGRAHWTREGGTAGRRL